MNKVSRFFLLTVLLFIFFSCGKTDVSDNGVVDNPTGGDIGAGNTEDEDIAKAGLLLMKIYRQRMNSFR